MRGGCERTQRNLYVLNLPLDATAEQFEALFGQHGMVEHAVILATLDHLARRRGFILMSDAAQARAAIKSLNGHYWHHYRIEVSFAIVQRSGAPFSEGTLDPLRDGLPTQPQAFETSEQPGQPNKSPGDHQGRQEAVLLLAGLDTSVVSSTAMVRALTEPFGEVIALYHTEQPPSNHEQDDGVREGDHAVVVYSTPSIAALARLALNGLVIGRSRVQAAIAPSVPRPSDNMRDNLAAETTVSSAPLLDPPRDPGTGTERSQLQRKTGSSLFGHVAGLRDEQASAAPMLSPRLIQQGDIGVYSASVKAWHSSDEEGEAAIDMVHKDAAFNNMRNFPRPIGDERQRAALTK